MILKTHSGSLTGVDPRSIAHQEILAPLNNNCTQHQGRKKMFYLTTHSTHYGYMLSDI